MRDLPASSNCKAYVSVLAAVVVTLAASPVSEAGPGRGGHGRAGHHGSVRAHGSFQGSFGHRTGHRSFRPSSFGHRSLFRHSSFGHRSFGHRSFSNRSFGRRSFKQRSFGHRSFGHRAVQFVQPQIIYSGYYPTVQPYRGSYPEYPGYVNPRHQVPSAPVAPQPIIIIQQVAAPAQAPVIPPVVASPAPATQPLAINPNALRSTQRQTGEVYLWIEQSEAAVYLDEDFLGTGEEIANLSVPLEMPSGVHVLSVEHRDYGSQRLVFASPSEEAILIEVNLSGNRNGRKARIRSPGEVESRLRLLRR